MTDKEMIERLEAVALWVSEIADGLPFHSAAEAMATGVESDVDAVLAALRSRPAPPDDLERKHRVPDDVMMLARAGKLIDAIKLLRHDFELPLKEAKLLVEDAMRIEAIRATAAALAAPAPVAAPAVVGESPLAHAAVEATARAHGWDAESDTLAGWLHARLLVAARAPETPAPTEPTR